uniref:Transglut_N domain-containing protein n=1 Tax=Syphacia muris TaxID=451379 RepID=A0A0N5A7M4_9BILA
MANLSVKDEASIFAYSLLVDSRTTPAKAELYSYGRRDSVNRTRFLLVRTSSNQGKESFKRITLPGGGTVDFLKFTVEKAMRRGKVAKVLLLPSQIPIERNEQLFELQDSQKVEVVFETNHKHQVKLMLIRIALVGLCKKSTNHAYRFVS